MDVHLYLYVYLYIHTHTYTTRDRHTERIHKEAGLTIRQKIANKKYSSYI